MEINRETIHKLLAITGSKPTKDLGQNFLVEPSMCEKIVNLVKSNKNGEILEVGPGLGSLTHFLNLIPGNLTCVDIDPNMIKILKDVYVNSNISFVEKNIMEFDTKKYDVIVGNLPYNITTDLITYLLLESTNCKQYTFMIQAEAFDRFFDTDGKEYGPASILTHLIGKIEKHLIVKPGNFYPAPQCNSLVFTISVEKDVNRDRIKRIYKMSKQLFLNRRKTILNNLSSYCGKEKAVRILRSLNIQENKRPEELSVQIFEQIFDLVNRNL